MWAAVEVAALDRAAVVVAVGVAVRERAAAVEGTTGEAEGAVVAGGVARNG